MEAQNRLGFQHREVLDEMVNIATAYRKSDWRLPRPYALIGYAVRNIARETGINSTELSNYVWDTARENASKEQATA